MHGQACKYEAVYNSLALPESNNCLLFCEDVKMTLQLTVSAAWLTFSFILNEKYYEF